MLHNAKRFLPSALVLAVMGVMGVPAFAQKLPLAQSPAGTTGRAPAPNVILTLDDSGSMTTDDGGPGGMTRVQALRNALVHTFSSSNPDVADGRIRLGWQMMNQCLGFPANSGNCNGQNLLRSLEGSDSDTNKHRGKFLRWARQVPADGWTPIHGAFQKVGEYLSRTDSENPWLDKPGDASSGFLPCRRSYHILMTDGSWNMGFNYDENTIPAARRRSDRTATTFPDGTTYNPGAEQTKVYTGSSSSVRVCNGYNRGYTDCRHNVSTISDMAFYYWSTDLQPGIPNKLSPLMRIKTGEQITDGSRTVDLQPYWNPKNDPSTWQNMVTYTIGFGDAASFKAPKWDDSTDDMYSTSLARSDYARLVTGAIGWPGVGSPLDNRNEMWHAAINGRGRFIPARNVDDLKKAFSTILSQISVDSQKPLTSFVASSASYSRNGTDFFHSGYDSGAHWRGYVGAQKLNPDGTLVPTPLWGSNADGSPKTTADVMDALSNAAINNRVILTSSKQASGQYVGVPFKWANIDASQKAALKTLGANVASDAIGEKRLEYLRGSRADEGASGARFRERKSRQGDIVNSVLWYAADPASNYAFNGYPTYANNVYNRLPIVYVGGNDGMLHGFSAVDGSEKIAYVPRGVYANLSRLTDVNYDPEHRYFVDGSPLVGDVQIGGTSAADWRTVLVGTLGAGGKGYFVLDVTNPGAKPSTSITTSRPEFTNANAQQLVLMDNTGDDDPDMGHIFGTPLTEEGNPQRPVQLVRMNNERWAFLTGNGVNSDSGQPVLFVQFLDGARETIKISAAKTGTEASGNGLSTPRPLDVNADGLVDYVYAGDLRGNMWKFDLTSNVPTQWKLATFAGASVPLFTAQIGSVRQPITTAPLLKPNVEVGGLMVAFGTGRTMTEQDRASVERQTFYAVLDKTRYKASGSSVEVDNASANDRVQDRTSLKERKYTSTSVAGSGAASGLTYWGQEKPTGSLNTKVDYKKGDRGWFFDLPEARERVTQSPEFYDGSRIIELKSVIPAKGSLTDDGKETCGVDSEASKGFRTLINIETGYPPTTNIMDVNGDGLYNMTGDMVGDGVMASRSTAADVEMNNRGQSTNLRHNGGAVNGLPARVDLRRLPAVVLRPNWRQLQ